MTRSRNLPAMRPLIAAFTAATALLLAAPALAHTTIKVDPSGEAMKSGLSVLDLEHVWVAIYGNDHFDVRDVARRTLRLGSRDTDGARANGFKMRDVNEDGFEDLLARFDVTETGLREASARDAVLTGGLKDGRSVFTAYDSSLGVTDDPASNCANLMSSGDVIGVRCTFTTSMDGNAPLDVAGLVSELNEKLASAGLSVQDNTPVVVELFGGHGHDGAKGTTSVGKKCKAGSGGGRGYARTIRQVSDLENLGPDLYLYVAEDGPADQRGGAACVLSAQDLDDIGSGQLQNPSAAKIIAIGAGGGGGGHGNADGLECKNGHDGGGGSDIATASTSGDVSTPGYGGSEGGAGYGGNPSSEDPGLGGPGYGDGTAGGDGIGGFGSNADATWNGAALTSWTPGEGGAGADSGKAGGGGGGFGGGGGAGKSNGHYGGGGGGGGYARKATVAVNSVPSDLILGPSYDPGYGAISLTFSLSSN